MDGDPARRFDVTCREFVELITAYLGDELDAATTAAVEAHLVECPGCTDYLWQMRATIAATGRLGCESMSVRTLSAAVAAFRDLLTP